MIQKQINGFWHQSNLILFYHIILSCVLFYFIPSINCISFYHCQFLSISFYISQFYFFILFYELQHQNITIPVICNQLNIKYNICNHICNIFKWFCWYTQVYQSTTSTGQTFVTVCWDFQDIFVNIYFYIFVWL